MKLCPECNRQYSEEAFERMRNFSILGRDIWNKYAYHYLDDMITEKEFIQYVMFKLNQFADIEKDL